MSVGPIVYTLVAEIGSTRLRTQTVVLGRSLYYFGNIIFGGILQPKFMAPGDWNLKGKTVSVLQDTVVHRVAIITDRRGDRLSSGLFLRL